MNYKDIEKFARENDNLARDIADFDCGTLDCERCIFYGDYVEQTRFRCISTLLSDVFDKEDDS